MKKAKVIDCNATNLQRLKKPRVLATLDFGGNKADLVVLPAKVFANLPECPYQRNHMLRAETVRYLETASPLHSLVLMTSVNGELRKLDGHTRAEKWANGSLGQPKTVVGLVLYCETYDQVQALYDQVDNRAAAKSVKEAVFSSWRSLGFLPQSEFFQRGSFKSAANAAFVGLSRTLPARELAKVSVEAVRKLDNFTEGLKHNTKKKAHPMVVAAALVGVQKLIQEGKESRLNEIAEFLQLVLEGVTQIDGVAGTYDAVSLLLEVLADETLGHCKARQEQIFHGALGALKLWFDSAKPRYGLLELVPLDRFQFLGIENPLSAPAPRKARAPRVVKMKEKAALRLQEKEKAFSSEMPVVPRAKVVQDPATFVPDLEMPETTVEQRQLIRPNLGSVYAKR